MHTEWNNEDSFPVQQLRAAKESVSQNKNYSSKVLNKNPLNIEAKTTYHRRLAIHYMACITFNFFIILIHFGAFSVIKNISVIRVRTFSRQITIFINKYILQNDRHERAKEKETLCLRKVPQRERVVIET